LDRNDDNVAHIDARNGAGESRERCRHVCARCDPAQSTDCHEFGGCAGGLTPRIGPIGTPPSSAGCGPLGGVFCWPRRRAL